MRRRIGRTSAADAALETLLAPAVRLAGMPFRLFAFGVGLMAEAFAEMEDLFARLHRSPRHEAHRE